jgi:hypothetical protein
MSRVAEILLAGSAGRSPGRAPAEKPVVQLEWNGVAVPERNPDPLAIRDALGDRWLNPTAAEAKMFADSGLFDAIRQAEAAQASAEQAARENAEHVAATERNAARDAEKAAAAQRSEQAAVVALQERYDDRRR